MFFDSGCVACGARFGPVCEPCAERLIAANELKVQGLWACRAAFMLDDRARTIVAAMKYRNQRRLAGWFADAMVDLVPIGADVITWIPATPKRRKLRGFDQAQELSRALSKRTGVPGRRLLRRAQSDVRQTGLSRDARSSGPALSALRGCPPMVVLIDDVVTTGSSLRVGARVLRSAGAQRVVGVAAATTPLGPRSLNPALGSRLHSPNGRET